MIALLLAASLFLDATPVAKVEAPRPALQTISDTTADDKANAGPVLSAVAVTLECTARANGHVEACHVLGETHPGLGFGEAAIALMRDAEVDPSPRDFQFARTIQFLP